MSIATSIKRLAKHTDDLEQTYLTRTGWTASPGLDGQCRQWTRAVKGDVFTFPQGQAMIAQRWLDEVL